MKKICLMFMVSILSISIITSFVSAEKPFEVNVKTPIVKSYCSSESFLELEITNNMIEPGDFVIEFEGKNSDWINTNETDFFVQPMSSEIFKIPINPSKRIEDSFDYEILIYLDGYPDYKFSRGFNLEITKLCIEKFEIEKIGDTINSELIVGTFEMININIVYEIKDKNEQIVSTIIFPEELRTSKKFKHVIDLTEDILAGDYSITARIEGYDIEKVKEFTIDVKHDIIETVTTVSTPLYKKVTVAINNNGNVVERGVKTEQSIPTDSITGYVTEPTNCQTVGNEQRCEYVIDEIMPGATAYVVYRMEFWPYWASYALVGIVISLIVGVSFLRITRPTLKKSSTRKAKNKHSIILHVKNPFRYHLKNVMVRDWISPLAKFDRKDIHGVKPVIRRSDAGTELIWRLGDIKPKEERILNYSINTLVEGNLRMPKANLRFRDTDDKRFRISSNQLILQ